MTLLLLALAACRPAAAPPLPTPRELLSRVDYEPFWSSDGSQITFISNRNGPFNVYTMRSDGSSVRRITTHAGPDDTPAFSPDARQIAFVSEIDGNPEVYVVPAEGGALRRLTRNPGPDLHPTWSPDGSSILYNAGSEDGQRIDLCVMSVEGRQDRCLTHGGINTYASYTGDGTRIVYRRSVGENRSQIRVLRPADGVDVAVTDGQFFDGWPAWSPDASAMVFASDRGGRFELYTVGSGGEGLRRIGGAGERSTNPRWDPKGRRVLFTARRGRAIDIFLVDIP
jgi:TolB protein